MTELTREDCSLIIESLRYTRERFANYPYPNEDLRRERVADVDHAANAIRALRREGRP